MRLDRFIPKRTFVFVMAALVITYCIFWMMGWINANHFCFFQHPIYIIAVYGGFYILIYRFDFWNTFFVSRYENVAACIREIWISLGKMAVGYVTILCILLYPTAWILQDQVTVSVAFLYYIYTTLSLIILCGLYIVLGHLWSPVTAKMILIASLFVGLSISFFGEFYITINFLFYNRNSNFTPLLIIQTGCVYLIIGCVLHMISQRGVEI